MHVVSINRLIVCERRLVLGTVLEKRNSGFLISAEAPIDKMSLGSENHFNEVVDAVE